MNDEKMLLAIKEKDEKVMALVIQKYSKLLWKVASAVLINTASVEDIEECVADAFIHLWMNPEKYIPEKGKLSSYLAMVVRSKAIDRYRLIARKQEVPIEKEVLIYQSEILTEIVSKEEKEKLLLCIEKLESMDREIVIRRFYHNQKPKAIAVALNLNGKQVENRLYRIKQKLRKMMEE